jgi:signal peptidase I
MSAASTPNSPASFNPWPICTPLCAVVHFGQASETRGCYNVSQDISEPETTSPAEPPLRNEVHREVVDFVKLVVWFLVLFIVLKAFVIEGYEVQGQSMEPTLHDRERILVFKLPHQLARLGLGSWIGPFERGDIIVFQSPDDQDRRYVKRVIATGPEQRSNAVQAGSTEGDGEYTEVLISDGNVFVNNQRVDEQYLPKGNDMTGEEDATVFVAPGDIYVMGDNRGVSKDSRSFGAVENKRLIGRAVLRIWPLSRFGLID